MSDTQKTKPTHYASLRHGYGKNAQFETIGVAWDNGDGTFYFKPYGTQVIGQGVTFYPDKTGVSENPQ